MSFVAALALLGVWATPAAVAPAPSVLLLTTLSGEGPVGDCKTAPPDAGDRYQGATSFEHEIIETLSLVGWTFVDPCAIGAEPPSSDGLNRTAMLQAARKANVTYVVTGSIQPDAPYRGDDSSLAAVRVSVDLKMVDLRTSTVAGAISETVADLTTVDKSDKGARKKALTATCARVINWLLESTRAP